MLVLLIVLLIYIVYAHKTALSWADLKIIGSVNIDVLSRDWEICYFYLYDWSVHILSWSFRIRIRIRMVYFSLWLVTITFKKNYFAFVILNYVLSTINLSDILILLLIWKQLSSDLASPILYLHSNIEVYCTLYFFRLLV